MFSTSTKLANIFMVMAALALCVSACTGQGSARTEASYDAPASPVRVINIAYNIGY